MTEDRLPSAELMQKAGGDDSLRTVAEAVVQLLMENDAEGLIGAGRHERTAERATYRGGYRDLGHPSRMPMRRTRGRAPCSCASPSCAAARPVSRPFWNRGRPRERPCRSRPWPNCSAHR